MVPHQINSAEWKVFFYSTRNKRSPVKKFIDGLGPLQRADFDKHVKLLKEFGLDLGMPYIKPIKGHKPLWEIRPDGFRVIFYKDSKEQFILLHAFPKKRFDIPSRFLDTALDRMSDYQERQE